MFIKDDAKVPVDLWPLKEDPSKWSIDWQDAEKSTVWIIATRLQGFLAPVDNFESGLFPPDLLLPTHPGRTFEPPIYNSWLKPENEERKNLKIRNQTRWHNNHKLLLYRKF